MLSWFQIPISKARRSLFSSQLAHPTRAYSGSLGWKDKKNYIARLPPSPPTPQDIIPLPCQFPGTHLYSWVKRGTMKVLFFARKHNTMTRLGYEPGPLELGSNAPSRRMPRHHWLFMGTEAGNLNAIAPWKAHYKRRTGRNWSNSVDKTRSPDCQKQSLRNPRTGVFEEEGFTFN